MLLHLYNMFFLLLISILPFSECQNYNADSSIVYWNDRNTLNWADFMIVDNINYRDDAHVQLGLPFSFSFSNTTLKVSINASLDISKSIVKRGSQNDALLRHEQGHFDLQEIYARKFRKSILESNLELITLGDDLNKISEQNIKLVEEAHLLYDNETEHSKNVEEQKRWESYIIETLGSLDKYSEPYIEIIVNK